MYFGRMMYVPQPGTFFTRKALEAVGGWRAESAIRRMQTSGFELRFAFQSAS